MQFHEQLGELLRLERGAAEVASRAEGTVVAVPLAGGREQGLQQHDLLPVGQLRRVDEGGILLFGCKTDGFAA